MSKTKRSKWNGFACRPPRSLSLLPYLQRQQSRAKDHREADQPKSKKADGVA
jgi:hypothetical protein